MKITTEKLTGHVLAAFTILVWGTTFIASKILLEEFTPLQVMILRFLIAYITLIILNHKNYKTSIFDELIFLLLAISGTVIYFILENRALTITVTSNVSILLSSAPILTAVLAHFFTKDEKINRNIFYGAFIAILGVAFVVFNGAIILQLNPIGDLMSFGAAISWAVYSIILKKYTSKFDSVYLTRRVVFYSIILTLPLLFTEGETFQIGKIMNPTFVLCLLFLGVLGSGVCYVFWNISTRSLGIVTTNNYIYLSPFVTMIAAKIILDEKITVMGIIGALLIVLGVVIAGRKKIKL